MRWTYLIGLCSSVLEYILLPRTFYASPFINTDSDMVSDEYVFKWYIIQRVEWRKTKTGGSMTSTEIDGVLAPNQTIAMEIAASRNAIKDHDSIEVIPTTNRKQRLMAMDLEQMRFDENRRFNSYMTALETVMR